MTEMPFTFKVQAEGEVVHADPKLWDENGNLKEQEQDNG